MTIENGSSSSNSLNCMSTSCGDDSIEAKDITELPKSLSNSKIISNNLKSPKKRMHESLSSSDNSISSECADDQDEPIKDEKDSKNADDKQIEQQLKNDFFPNISDMPASKLKITYKFHNSETKLLKRIFSQHGLTEAEGDSGFNILWTGVHMKPDILRNLTPYQRVNHFPRYVFDKFTN